jgi:WD40 repeat protein
LATVSVDKTIRLWSLLALPPAQKKMQQVGPDAILRAHTDSVECLLVFNGVAFSGSQDKSIISWNVDDFQMLCTFIGHTGPITALAGMQDQLFSAGADNTIRQWDMHTSKLLATMKVHTYYVAGLLISL